MKRKGFSLLFVCVYEWVGPARIAATAEKEGAGEGESEDAAEGGPE